MVRRKQSQFNKLLKLGIRHFDELIHDQPKEWLIKHFKKGADEYPVNVAMLIRNVIWQTRERIIKKTREPITELLRTFWYMYVKSTLARAGALSKTRDQYADMIEQFVFLVMKQKIMKYNDFGFRDENAPSRKVGINAYVILFAEKSGHVSFLEEMHQQYQISTIALGGQPGALTSEYFVRSLKEKGVNLQRSFFLFDIVDYDTSGWIISNAFINNLKDLGIKSIRCQHLVTPDMLTPEEMKLAKYPIRDSKKTHKKNIDWLKKIKAEKYNNQKYLNPAQQARSKIYYGLLAESVSTKRFHEKLKKIMVPLLGKNEQVLNIHFLEELHQALFEMTSIKVLQEVRRRK